MELFLVMIALGILILPVILIIAIARIWGRAARLEHRIEALTCAFDHLRNRVRELERAAQAPIDRPAESGLSVVATPAAEGSPAESPLDVPSTSIPPQPEAAAIPTPTLFVEAQEQAPATAQGIAGTISYPPPAAAARPPAPHVSPATVTKVFDWESLVGVKLFSWVAGIALALAAIFFLRYSIDRGWLMPPIRMAVGLMAGAGLLMLCELKAARRYPVTANALDASAIAILFATFFAAHAQWQLVGATLTFVLLVLVTALAVWLSIRRDSVFISLLGLLGGFATPALLSTGENRPIPLFGYLLILNAGLAWVAYRKNWRLLTLLSLILTTSYQWGWVIRFLNEGDLSLAAGIFLIFPILGYGALVLSRIKVEPGGEARSFERTANLGAILPLVFALYMPTVPAYGGHIYILFGFLLCLDAGLAVVAIARGAGALHFAGGLSTLLVFAIWLQVSYRSSAWPEVLAFLSLFFLLYLMAPSIGRRFGKSLQGLDSRAVYTAPLLVAVFAVLARVEPKCAAPGVLFAVLFFLVVIASLVSFSTGTIPIYLLTAVLVLAAEGVWTLYHLKVSSLQAGLALYGVFGLLYIAVPFVAHWRRTAAPAEGDRDPCTNACIFLGLTAHLFLYWIAGSYSLAIPPWPLFVVMAVLNVAIGGVAFHMRRGDLHLAAVVASSLILVRWTVTTGVAHWPTVAVLAAGVLVAFACLWMFLAGRSGIEDSRFAVAAAGSAFLAQVVAILAAEESGSPDVWLLMMSHVALLIVLLVISWLRRWHFLSVLALLPAALAQFLWQAGHTGRAFWSDCLLLASPIYILYLAYPLILGRRAGRLLEPYLAAVVASAAFFLVARRSLLDGGWEGIIGLLPVTQAALAVLHLRQLLRLESPGARMAGRLALVAGTVLAFVTVTIPLQLEKQWITIGWALEGAALAWLYGRIPHRGVLQAASLLLSAVFVRLAMNSQVLTYHPRGIPILNWYLYTYIVSAAALIIAGRLLSRTRDVLIDGLPRVSSLLPGAATVLLFLLVNIEIADFYSPGETITFNFSATLAQDLTYTLAWGLFALGLLVAGIMLQNRPARVAAIILLVATILKCFLHDLSRLGGLYRVGSFVGLAICLALVAIVLQKYVLAAKPPAGANE